MSYGCVFYTNENKEVEMGEVSVVALVERIHEPAQHKVTITRSYPNLKGHEVVVQIDPLIGITIGSFLGSTWSWNKSTGVLTIHHNTWAAYGNYSVYVRFS
ncbi:hypothetical protein L4D00_14930 [Photobacterium swingsii]|uniref:hypothetical protein n=1 Tax=Photobacterium swingsii TaxID=680026 RepID=UPI003D12C176